MENTMKISNLVIIRIDEVVHWVLKRMAGILLCGLLLAVAGGAYASTQTSVPMYKTTTKLYVTGVQTTVPSANSFSLGKQVINNYMELLKSRPVLEDVINTLGLNMSTNQLASCISMKVPSDTCMLEVTVFFPDAQWAKKVADELVVASAEYALEVMGCTPPTVYEEAAVPSAPYNTTAAPVFKYALVGGAAGILLAGLVVLISYFTNRRFDTPGRLSDKLGCSVFAVIPKEESYQQNAGDVLVSRLSYEAKDSKLCSFVRTSTKEDSYAVMKLAAKSFSTANKKVICIDTNLCNPEWSTMQNNASGQKGLYDYLVKEEALENVIIKGKEEPDKIVCGKKALNAAELLLGEKFAALLEKLQESYDFVFLDTAPFQLDVASCAASQNVDNVIWVISAEHTDAWQTKSALKQLDDNDVVVNGLVFTDYSVKKKGKYFKKKYGSCFGSYEK